MLWNRSSTTWKTFFRRIIPGELRQKGVRMLGLHKTRPFRYPPMDKELDTELRERYKPEIIRLSEIIDRDLSHWLP